MYNLFTFHSTHAAIYLEKTLMAENQPVKLIPVPRTISSSCGLAARIPGENYSAVMSIIHEHEIEIADAYTMSVSGEITILDF